MGSVILSHAPAEVIRIALLQLGQATTGTAYEAWPVFHDMEPDKPDNVISVHDTDGLVQTRHMIDGEVQENHGIMIKVRGVKGLINNVGYSGSHIARKKIDGIVRALDQQACRYSIGVLDPIGTGVTLYTLHSANRTSTVIRVGRQRNNSERYIYTVNYLMSLTQD